MKRNSSNPIKSNPSNLKLENPFSTGNGLNDKSSFSDNSTIIKDRDGVGKTIGSAVSERAINDATTPDEVDIAIEVGNEVQQDASLNVQIKEASKYLQDVPAPENPEIGSGGALKRAINFDRTAERDIPQLTVNDITQGLIEQEPGIKQEYLDEFNSYSKKQNAISPALERLGVQDYYPDLGANISVGSYSRKTLGSGNIYVAQGGLIPRTVIDARDRAMEKQAMATQGKIDEIKNKRFVTSEQYQQQYDDSFLDWQNKYIKEAGANVQLLTDPNTKMGRDYLEGMTRWENLYKENKYVDGYADEMRKAYEKGDYVPEYGLKMLDDWDNGRTDVEGFINGDSKASSLIDKMKAYQNSITWGDEKVKELAKSGGLTMPIRPDVDFNNPEIAKNAQEALIYKPGQSNDQYISALRKYYDTSDIEEITDQAFNQNRFYKGNDSEEEGRLKANLMSYMLSSLPETITVDQKVVGNDNMENKRLAFDKEKHKWDVDKEMFNRKSNVSFYEMADQGVIEIGDAAVNDVINNPNLSAQQKQSAIKNLMVNSGNYSEQWSKRIGWDVLQMPISTKEKEKANILRRQDYNISYDGKTYKLTDAENQLRLAKSSKNQESIDHWTKWNEVDKVAIGNGGVLTSYTNERLLTPMNIYTDEKGVVQRKPGQYMDGKGEVNTLSIDVSNSYISGSDEDGNNIISQFPSSTTVYTNLSDDKVKGQYDNVDSGLSNQAKKGEGHRNSNNITSKSTTTIRRR